MSHAKVSNLSIFGLGCVILIIVGIALSLILKFVNEKVIPVKQDISIITQEIETLHLAVADLKKNLVLASQNNDVLTTELNHVTQEFNISKDKLSEKSKDLLQLQIEHANLESNTTLTKLAFEDLKKKFTLLKNKLYVCPKNCDTPNVSQQGKDFQKKYLCPTAKEVRHQFTRSTWKTLDELTWTIEFAHHEPKEQESITLSKMLNFSNRLVCYYELGTIKQNKQWLTVTLIPKQGKKIAQIGQDWKQCKSHDKDCQQCDISKNNVCSFDTIKAM